MAPTTVTPTAMAGAAVDLVGLLIRLHEREPPGGGGRGEGGGGEKGERGQDNGGNHGYAGEQGPDVSGGIGSIHRNYLIFGTRQSLIARVVTDSTSMPPVRDDRY